MAPACRLGVVALSSIAFIILCQAEARGVTGYIAVVPPESNAARTARHKAMAEVRSRPIIICHRGASAFAPENTLEAFASALAQGGDGCEVDLGYTADRVLICFHGPTVEPVTHGFGLLDQFTYPQLLSFGLRSYGSATSRSNIPTFAALVEFARRTNMLLFLDVKVPGEQMKGFEEEVIKTLDEADAWDHVVEFDGQAGWGTPSKLRTHPSFKRLQCNRWLFGEHKIDWDPEQVKKAIPPPGQMIMVDDPRVAASLMGRRPRRAIPPPESVYAVWPQPQDDPGVLGTRAYAASLGIDPDSPQDLLKLLKTDLSTRDDISGDDAYQNERAERIWARAWAAFRLGELGCKSSGVVPWLEFQIKHGSRHRDRYLHGADAIAAVTALGKLGAVESVPLLLDRFNEIESDVGKLTRTESGWREPASKLWDTDVQFAIVRALKKTPCDAAKQFLKARLKSKSDPTKQYTDYMEDTVSSSLAAQSLSRREIEELLTNGSPELRANLIVECIDHPAPERRAALKSKAPWALKLPRAR